MIDAGHRKHAEKVECDGQKHRKAAPSDPNDAQATKMKDDERNAANKIDAIGLGTNDFWTFSGIIGINPLNERGGVG